MENSSLTAKKGQVGNMLGTMIFTLGLFVGMLMKHSLMWQDVFVIAITSSVFYLVTDFHLIHITNASRKFFGKKIN